MVFALRELPKGGGEATVDDTEEAKENRGSTRIYADLADEKAPGEREAGVWLA
jgi:hypothetical protein